MPIVLASASPRRQELLKNAGIKFVVQPANIPEVRRKDEAPQAFAERMAEEKARFIWQKIGNHRTLGNSHYVLGADTVVAVEATEVSSVRDDRMLLLNHGVTGVSPVEVQLVLGKPDNPEHAARMLRQLSSRKHHVITGVCLIGNDFEDVRSETTAIHFAALSDSDIRNYIASGEPMDKAGAYAIQGAASRWISKIEGDYSNVVGLPIALVLQMLREHRVIVD
jgi:septum formation protein